jgi:hypothetical protein
MPSAAAELRAEAAQEYREYGKGILRAMYATAPLQGTPSAAAAASSKASSKRPRSARTCTDAAASTVSKGSFIAAYLAVEVLAVFLPMGLQGGCRALLPLSVSPARHRGAGVPLLAYARMAADGASAEVVAALPALHVQAGQQVLLLPHPQVYKPHDVVFQLSIPKPLLPCLP